MPATLKLPPVQYDVTPLKGGLDQLTPTLSLNPSFCREMVNFDCAPTGGYRRVGGYERLDGRAKPSAATYAIVAVTSFINMPTVGQTLTGATSGTTGKIIAINTASNYMVLTQVSGSYTALEIVSVGVTMIGVHTTLMTTITPEQNAIYTNLAADVYRALITAVPGSGPVRGVVSVVFSGVREIYAWRNNAGGTAGVMHKATTSGWTAVPMFYEVSFTAGGTATPADGDFLAQGANNAQLKRAVLESGSWAAGTAAGRLILTNPTPGSLAAGAATIGAVNVTLSGAQAAIVFSPGGHYEFDIGNFFGQLSGQKLYGCNGLERCFEFDGTVLVPISTKAAVDTPKHIKVHNNFLIVSIGSSIMGSAVGEPYIWAAGGFEIAIGDTITGFLVQPGNQDTATLGIYARNSSGMLYGTSVSDFKFVKFKAEVGSLEYMCQNLEQSYTLDDRGVVDLRTAQEFGNFAQATLTQKIQTFIADKRSLAACSSISKDQSQYRAFFSDGSGLYLTIVNGKFIGAGTIFVPDPFFCAWNGESAAGDDECYVGSQNGYVYQLEKGSSFDGENIDATLTLNWNFLKSPRIRKRFRRASLEIQGLTYAAVQFGYTLGYDSSEIDQPTPVTYPSNLGGGGVWDVDHWDAFTWDGLTLSPTEVEMTGTAENVKVTLASTSDYIYPFVMNSVVLHHTPRRGLR